MESQTIIINEKGELIKQAFIWRANAMTYEQIIEKLKHLGLNVPKQTLGGIFKNPFYCGFMSHNLLNGEVIKGRHPALIDEELFLRANEIKKTEGYTTNKANDNLPLKVFVKDAESGAPFTGYLVKKKGLYYYKVNKIGIRINRSTNIMHDKFKELLATYTVDSAQIEPLSIQLRYTWENLTETNTGEKKALSLKLNEVEEEFYNLRKRHAIGAVSLDIYEEFSTEMKVRKEKLLGDLEKLDQKLSNPKELIHFTCKLSANLAPVWALGDYYQKQIFQNTVFPKGLVYDSKIEHYRTPIVNDVIVCVAHTSRALEEIKKPDFLNLSEKSGLVLRGYSFTFLFSKYSEGYRVKAQDKTYYLVERHLDQGKFRLKPDLLVESNATEKIIIDTKWKLIDQNRKSGNYNISQADMYQLYAYGKKYTKDVNEPRLVLLYPTNPDFTTSLPEFIYEGELRLDVIPFNLSNNYEEQINSILQKIDSEINIIEH